MINLIAWLYWDPPKVAFTVPLLERPVVWYGILFVTGFILGYFITIPLLSRFLRQSKQMTESAAKQMSYFLTDRFCWFVVLGTIVGARLGHVFFYESSPYKDSPLEILQIWKGGLASHGGVVGVMMGVYFFSLYVRKWVPDLTFVKLLDIIAIPAALGSCFIRLGNFMNQEILGTPTTVPWAIVFGNSADGTAPLPRHPVQLYEAAVYFVTFVVLYQLWKRKGDLLPEGTFIGLLLISIFGSRFILEFWKDNLDSNFNTAFLQVGQLLSIPLIILGFFFLWRGFTKEFNAKAQRYKETQKTKSKDSTQGV